MGVVTTMTADPAFPILCQQCQSTVREAVDGLCAQCLSRTAFWEEEAEMEMPVSEATPLELGNYVLHEEIGRGGMGVVYRARQRGLERDVALKVIAAGPLADPELIRRFRSEAKAAARLQHPHIVPVYEVGETPGHAFLSMEFIPGPTLSQRVRRGGPMVPCRAAACLVKVAGAIQHAHDHDLLHRDVKPSNILLDPDEEPFVVDFGLAKSLTDLGEPELTLTRQTVGTPGYFAPEQAEANARLDVRTDVYGLGAALYFTLTGRPPFPGKDMAILLEQVRHTEPSPPRLFDPSIPRDLETICLKALEKAPAKRYTTARDMAEDLSRFLAGDPILARPLGTLGRAWRWVQRHRALSAALAGLLAVLLGSSLGMSYLWFQARDSAQKETVSRQQAEDELWKSLIVTARNERLSGLAGSSERALAAVRRAASQRVSVELTDEAIAALAMPDIVPLRKVSWRGTNYRFQERLFAFHPQLECALATLEQGQRVLLETENGALRHSLEGPPGSLNEQQTFSATGRYVVANQPPTEASAPGTFLLWETESGQRLALATAPGVMESLWSSDDSQLVLLRESSVEFLAMPAGTPLRQLTLLPNWRGPSLSPDGSKLALDYGSTLVVLDATNGAILQSLGHPKTLEHSAWNATGNLLAVGCSDWQLHIWEVSTGQKWSECRGHDLLPAAQEFVHGTDWLLSGSWDHTWRLWEARSGRSLALLPGGEYLLVPGGAPWLWSAQHWPEIEFSAVRIPEVLRMTREPTQPTSEHSGVQQVAWSQDGRLLFTAGGPGGLNAWDAGTLQHLGSYPSHAVSVETSPPASLTFTGWGGLQRVDWAWEGTPSTFHFLSPQQLGRTEFCNRTSQSADGQTLAVSCNAPGANYGQQLEIWREGRKINEWKVAAQWPHLALNPDGTLLAVGGDGLCRLEIFHTADGTPLPLNAAPADLIERASLDCAFSPDGHTLVTQGRDRIALWDLPTRQRRNLLPRPLGAQDCLVAFSPDGRWIAAAGIQRDVWLLDPTTGQRLATLTPPLPVMLADLAFSPDSQQLAIALTNRTLHVWHLPQLSKELATKLGMTLR